MKVEIVQEFDAAPDEVLAVYSNPDFYRWLSGLTKVQPTEVLRCERHGEVVDLAVRYRFIAPLSSAVTKVISPEKLTWVESSRLDLSEGTAQVMMAPDNYGNMLRLEVDTILVRPKRGGGTTRTIPGDFGVKGVPFFVRGPVEGAISSGLREHYAEERDKVIEWLAERG